MWKVERGLQKLYAVIGDPISHSMSPAMHNDWLQHYHIDAHYHAFHIKNENLKDAVKGFRAMGVSGFNITIPHKVAIMPYLDEIDPLAQTIGAVNTVVNEDGKLIGFNTDGIGYLNGIQPYFPSIQNKKVLIIGAGGAARAIYFSMAYERVEHIDIANRTIEKAQNLQQECPYDVSTKTMTIEEAEELVGQYDLIVQTTSIGMKPYIDSQPISLQHLRETTVVSDIIYNPFETKFLQTARLKGAKTQNGIDMLVYQGALAFEKWTGIAPDTDRIKIKLGKQLGGIKC